MENRAFALCANSDTLPSDINPQMTLAMANGWLTKWLTVYSETIRSHSGRICLNPQKKQLILNLKSRLPWPILTVGSISNCVCSRILRIQGARVSVAATTRPLPSLTRSLLANGIGTGWLMFANMSRQMKNHYRAFLRPWGVYYCEDLDTGKQETLKTRDRDEAFRLVAAGPQVRKWRNKKPWSQQTLAARLQLRGWDISRDSLASLELQRRRVPDCELVFLSRALGVSLAQLFPKNIALSKIGPQFKAGQQLALFPTRAEK